MDDWVVVPTTLDNAANTCDIMFDWRDDEDVTKPDIYIARDLTQEDADQIVREHSAHVTLAAESCGRARRMDNNKAGVITIAAIWGSVAVAVSVGILVTGSAGCLGFFLIPACMSIKTKSDEDEGDGE